MRYRADLDARDRIDAGADLTFATDPSALRYAAARTDLVSVPLPWQHTYLLLLPHGANAAPTPADDTIRVALARDAVRAEARAAQLRSGNGLAAHCIVYGASGGDAERSARVLYRSDDPIARQLAERLVALAGMRAGGSLTAALPSAIRAAGLSPSAFDAALAEERGSAFVIDVPTRDATSCSQEQGVAAVPLIETRDHAIVRRDRLFFTLDADGIPRITAAAPRE